MLKFSFRQQVLAGFVVSVFLVLLVGILSYKSIGQLQRDSLTVDHTQKVIKTSTNLLQLLVDAETAMRGYAVTNNKEFLEPVSNAFPRILSDLNELKVLLQDNPLQLKRIDSLAIIVDQQIAIIKENIDTRAVKSLDTMVEDHMFIRGKNNMDHIRAIIGRVDDTENELLASRKASSEAAASRVLFIILNGSVVFFLIVVLLFIYIQRTFNQRKKIGEEIRITNIQLEKVLAENEAKTWQLTGSGLLNDKMQGQQSEKELAENILNEICRYTKALAGTFYLFDENEQRLKLFSSYAFHNPDAIKKEIELNEGWIGQVAVDGRPAIIKGTLNDEFSLSTSVLKQPVLESIIVPFFFDKQLKGVIELAFNEGADKNNHDLIMTVVDDIGIAVNTAQARSIMHDLLAEVRQQAEELEAQQEEMRVTNDELLSKTEMLEASEEELRVQQDELRNTNVQLEEKASLLEEKNQAIEEAKQAIDIKISELETTGKYRSEFLANMSHELRTPLNSILVLAQILKENRPANLSEDQLKYAGVIFNAGNDLLTLINDILDLSKVESGTLEMQSAPVKVADILHDMEMLFAQVAVSKKIEFIATATDPNIAITTDKVRLEQILKNLLSNAFKFTPQHGSIAINVKPGNDGQSISFYIKDTGIGIPYDKQKIIFEAFQQADGSTSRKYGGTGLGLSISRELAALLGGNITLTSEPDSGSEFVLTVPLNAKQKPVLIADVLPGLETLQTAPDFLKVVSKADRASNAEPVVIIVEDDKNFATILQDYALQHGYRPVLLNEGTKAVEVIRETQPDAVILDIMLPGKDGWQILKELKQDERTIHIPVHLMSAGETAANRVHREGAIGFLKKPIDTGALNKLFSDIMHQSGNKFKQVLLIEDHKEQSQALKELMQSQGITLDQAFDGDSAYRMLYAREYQCVILDLNLPDMSGLDLLDKIKAIDRFKELPVIINTAMELDKTSVNRLMQYANAMVVKTNKSADRLIDEVNLFLNKIAESSGREERLAPISKPKINTTGKDALKGKKILVVDDDMRNVFALTSALQNYDLLVEIANDGEEAIAKLNEISDIDLVLMDIMMPKMDGYEAMRHIRSEGKWFKLPIIALTAKAMIDDREECIAAGASDYITKPVDLDRLISLMQLWMEG